MGGYIKLDLQEVRFGVMDCSALAEDRDMSQALVNTVITFGNLLHGISSVSYGLQGSGGGTPRQTD